MQKYGEVIHIVQLFDLPLPDIQPLLQESRTENHRFVDRLTDEYINGSNRFGLPGETLFAAYAGDQMIGIGGLNQDPYVGDAGNGDAGCR